MSRFLSLLLVPILFFASSQSLLAGHGSTLFPDITQDDRYYLSISQLHLMDIVRGNQDGSLNPEGFLNRAEIVVIVNRAGKIVKLAIDRDCLEDIRDEWFAEDICAAIRLGFIKGYPDGLFRPDRVVTAGEAAKILVNIIAGKNFQELSEALAWLEERGLYLEKFDLNAPIKRNETFERLFKIIMHLQQNPSMLDQMDSEGNPFDPDIDPIKNQIGAGEPTYVPFSQKAYEHFLGQSPIILFFHAPWCPLCRKSDEVLLEMFDDLEGGVIWLKTDYDSETELKKQYGITYQDTFVVINSAGEVVLKGSTLGSFPSRAQEWMNSALGQ